MFSIAPYVLQTIIIMAIFVALLCVAIGQACYQRGRIEVLYGEKAMMEAELRGQISRQASTLERQRSLINELVEDKRHLLRQLEEATAAARAAATTGIKPLPAVS